MNSFFVAETAVLIRRAPRHSCGVFILILWIASPLTLQGEESRSPVIEFNRDIRPILADNCFQCHGPDAKTRQADLRLDSEAGALAKRKGPAAISRENPAASELLRRILATDEQDRMPPPDSGKHLTPEQIELLRRWIDQGAAWQRHWAFLPPQRQPPPAIKDRAAARGGIDSFILARLEKADLSPAPEASKNTLIRRVSLDLTGLPPTIAELEEALADAAPDAFERLVDRLLASPRHGERLAVPWLNAARYADTNGYQSDGQRQMWRWRDWVIEAFNQNLPFDRFTIEQLAGDLLANPTLDQRIATGFNRNHRGNAEGGIIPEEYAVEYVVDRVETTSTVWLGLTLGCARCHDHKFDPFSQRDFYSLYAFFNSVPEKGRAVKFGNSPPVLKAPTRRQQQELATLEEQVAVAELRFAQLQRAIDDGLAAYERASPKVPLAHWLPAQDALTAQFRWDGKTPGAIVSANPALANPPQFEEGAPEFVAGRHGTAAVFNGRSFLNVGDAADFGYDDKFTLAAWILVGEREGGTIVSRMTDAVEGDGYQLALVEGKLQLNLVKRWLDDSTRVETAERLPSGQWHHVAATYAGSRVAAGMKLYLDGKPQAIKINLDELNQPSNAKQPLRIGAGGGPALRFRGQIEEVCLFNSELTEEHVLLLAVAEEPAEILAIARERRAPAQAAKLRQAWIEQLSPLEIRDALRGLVQARRRLRQFQETVPTVMVMEELPLPRDANILLRGQYDQPGAAVSRNAPASLETPFSNDLPRNRLGLARWLVDPRHPLTARVTVNRLWQMFFGVGLVKTVEDFGSQGEWPAHLALLDWLAVEFRQSGWDLKALERRIVSSGAYRQSSAITPQLLQIDPENRLLARGPRLRLSAEAIRDQALWAGGLLVEQIGGPSVMPYQPPGLWKELTGGDDYQPGQGADLYRRGMYTYWKRTIAPPAMLALDASTREFCTVRETRTNTPLQALTLLNEQTFVEASRGLATRALREGGRTSAERLAGAFRLVTSRGPKPAELEILTQGLERHLSRKKSTASAAPAPEDEELSAYAAVMQVILNLDETLTNH